MKELTLKQKQVLTCIVAFIAKHSFAPSSRELGALLEHSSPSTTHRYLVTLKEKGYVDWIESKPRTLRVLKGA
ncbi:helix-turn-helix domain-containing protein [Halalkalibacter suaedae]|uniref:Helix-turn-helix domain-containing protein n=1 Tax=Halalkalibacter suaedae TaxID=2822140 RepID=A0A941AN05_9BACI|nr:helix-turn-helix domain-containing protein [Bacillus suaedae]MBP3950353.1 helix-turn-helix domain-containing protein [Bacillus suaedae]MBP3951115.1 helix-turn-helix domain-containing protein [Bacillus suaedae]